MYCPEGVLEPQIYGAGGANQGTVHQSIRKVINNSKSRIQL